MADYTTRFGSLADFQKGGVEALDDDPRRYAFSNLFEVASKSPPWQKTAVGKNAEYVLEALRAEGRSPWFAAGHDEFALTLDGVVDVELLDPAEPPEVPESGSVALREAPAGTPMGRIRTRRGHMALLPAGRCYRFSTDAPAVVLLQTVEGPQTVFCWDEICQRGGEGEGR